MQNPSQYFMHGNGYIYNFTKFFTISGIFGAYN